MTAASAGADRARLLADAATRGAAYAEASSGRRIAPAAEAVAALDELDGAMPEAPMDAHAVLERLDRVGSPATVVSTQGRYFGFVNGGTLPALGAAVLTSAWDQNVALPVMSPAAARIDAIAARWVTELLGLPPGASATFCGGASIANLTCVLAARDALLARNGWDVRADGLAGSPPLRVVASEEIHVSVLKALGSAGIGRKAITFVPTDRTGGIDPSGLPRLDDRTLVLVQAGNVNTGYSDPFGIVVGEARESGAWVHVDGAFGLWAAAAPTRSELVAGVQGADSWATDAHKWLNTTYDCGIAICARADDLRRAHAQDASYLETDAERALMHLGLQMSQRARGVEVWAALASLGREGLAGLIEQTCGHAQAFAERLGAAGVEVLVPPVLNQVLVRFGDDATTDAVITAVQADGTCWAGGSTWKGSRVMRLSVSDHATSAADVEASAAAIVRCWHGVTGTG